MAIKYYAILLNASNIILSLNALTNRRAGGVGVRQQARQFAFARRDK